MAGRHTDYKEEYNEQAYKLTLLGFTDKDLARFFEVTETTINNWKDSHPTFFESILKGKDIADAEVAKSLYMRAKGYDKVVKSVKVVDGVKYEEEKENHYPADFRSIQHWLRNRQSKKWKDKQEDEDGTLKNISVNVNIVRNEDEDAD